jgi:hypothetical protein
LSEAPRTRHRKPVETKRPPKKRPSSSPAKQAPSPALFTKSEYNRARRQKVRAFLSVYLQDRCCESCGEADPCCLSFHHRPGTAKAFKIADSASKRVSIKALQAELAKCEVLCANCHLKHHNGMHWEARSVKREPEQREHPKRVKLSSTQIREIHALLAAGEQSQDTIAEMFGISQAVMSRIGSREHWPVTL